MIIDEMLKELTRDEGEVLYAYQDHLGYWTLGVGRLIDKRKGGGITHDEAMYLLKNDIARAYNDISNEPWFLACDTDSRQRALVNMRFQLGPVGIRTFRTSLGLIAQRKWLEAGANLRKSLWYRQTPERAERVIRQLEIG
jgi:lysozyme